MKLEHRNLEDLYIYIYIYRNLLRIRSDIMIMVIFETNLKMYVDI